MRLTNVPNLRTEDFPSEQKWISKLFIQLNPFIQSLNQMLNLNVDYDNNIKSVTKNFSLSNGFSTFSFIWPFTDVPPQQVSIIQAYKGPARIPTVLIPAWSYIPTDREISISNLTELSGASVIQMSGNYQIRVRATV